MRRALWLLVVMTARVAAQPAPCAECARGDALIEHFSLQPLRAIAPELSGMKLVEPVSPTDYGRVVDLRRRVPAAARLGAVDDLDLSAIAASLCGSADPACVEPTTLTMRCLADRCAASLPPTNDLVESPCETYSKRRPSPRFGVGLDWATGWQRSKHPTEGRAWSLGIETRLRITPRIGAIARVDRISGRDEATDADGDGNDDGATGSITRLAALGGASVSFLETGFEKDVRFFRFELLAGYLLTRSQPDESGFAAAVDASYNLAFSRIGVRFIQGTGDAKSASTLLAHIGFVSGARPFETGDRCRRSRPERPTRLGLGIGWILGGYGHGAHLGYIATGLGFEALWKLVPKLDALLHADIILFPGEERERTIHQAVLGGLRIHHGKRRGYRSGTGWYLTAAGGYSHGATITPTTTGSGPIADLSLGWGALGREGGGGIRLHVRSGISPDNVDYRAAFVSIGGEVHMYPDRW